MSGNSVGSAKVAAKRIGVTLEEWKSQRDAGHKWCSDCKAWQPVSAFGRDRSRGDGRSSRCRDCARRRGRQGYQFSLGLRYAGRRYVAPRAGDRKQARRRVNHLVRVGLLPRPNDTPCTDCGHKCAPGQRRHEYDHHQGYSAENQEVVEAVCTTCHRRRDVARG